MTAQNNKATTAKNHKATTATTGTKMATGGGGDSCGYLGDANGCVGVGTLCLSLQPEMEGAPEPQDMWQIRQAQHTTRYTAPFF